MFFTFQCVRVRVRDHCFCICGTEEHTYTLQDAEAELLFGFTLEESIKRANSSPLFKVK